LSNWGKECCRGTATGQYLRNRLERAFLAGADFQAERIKELEDSIQIACDGLENCKDIEVLKEYMQGLKEQALSVKDDNSKDKKDNPIRD